MAAASTASVAKTAYEIALENFDRAADALGLDENARAILRHPERELTVSVPAAMDDGRVLRFDGFRVQHSTALGPAKGGIRFHPNLTLDELRAAAMSGTWKRALAGGAHGGAAGGVACDPKALSAGEMERLARRYARAILPLIGPEQDIPAADACLPAQALAWMMEEFGMRPAAEGVGRSVLATVVSAWEHLKIPAACARIAVQGFGGTGSVAAALLCGAGAKVVAVSDGRDCVYSAGGLDVSAVAAHRQRTGRLAGFAGSEPVGSEELLAMECEALIAAEGEGAITEANAHTVRARVVAEAAEGAVTPGADRALERNGVFVIPDILCDAGAVAFGDALKVHCERKAGMRLASHMVAVGRVGEARKARGM